MAAHARDVAERVGVSLSTVSRAFTNPEMVNPVTLERIRDVANDLGYVPTETRRSLRVSASDRARPQTIAFMAPDIANPYFAAIAQAAQQRARARNLNTIVADTNEDFEQESEILAEVLSSIQGVICCSPRSAEAQIVDMASSVPMVLVNRTIPSVPGVTVDEHDAMVQALTHLTALGHRRIAYVGGPVTSASEVSRTAALTQLRTAFEDAELLHVGNFSSFATGGVAAADLVVATGATAVIGFNDLVALGILSQLHQRGVRVPADVSVVGFDNVLVAGSTYPALTTLSMPYVRMGAAAVDLLNRRIQGRADAIEHMELTAELVVRQSTGPAPPSSS